MSGERFAAKPNGLRGSGMVVRLDPDHWCIMETGFTFEFAEKRAAELNELAKAGRLPAWAVRS
jgi:hypothetical protein